MRLMLVNGISTESMIAELRDSFLDMSVADNINGYDVLTEAACDQHVLYYVAQYIDYLESLNDSDEVNDAETEVTMDF